MSEQTLKKYDKIKFPQNVFLISSYFETGEVEALSHGLFQDKDEDILEAQKHFDKLLFRHLYKTPAKLLEVGVGSGQTHEKLLNKGFECTGISSDKALISMIENDKKNTNLLHSHFKDFELDKGESDFDVILFKESTQSITPDDLFTKADELLSIDGRILITDTFSRDKKPFHDIENFLSVAQMHGFSLIQEKDLSKEAALTLDYRLKILDDHKDKICQELALSEEKFTDLTDMLQKHKKNYNNNKYFYFFLEFKKALKKPSPQRDTKQIQNLQRQEPVSVLADFDFKKKYPVEKESEALYSKAKPRFSLETSEKQIKDVPGIKTSESESLEVIQEAEKNKPLKKVILHIGSSKTGSSALQSFFLDHQSVLEESGFYYPSHATDVNKMSSGNGMEIVAIAEQLGLEAAEKRVDEIIAGASQEHIIISTEYFYPYPELVHTLFPEATIIVYFREPTVRLESEYNQSIKRAFQTRHHLDALKDILDGEDDAIYSGMIMKKWMDLYGKENIILRPYEKEQFKGGSIFSDFITSIGIDWNKKFKLPKSRVNVSYTRDAQEFKLLLNRVTVQQDEEAEKMIDQALQAYSEVLYDKGEPKYTLLSKKERAKLMEHYEPSNRFIAEELLNRKDGQLFYTSDNASKLPDYPGLSEERIRELAQYIAKEYPKSIPSIVKNIKNGLTSNEEMVKNAAETLSALLSIFEK